jgi:hypothetical protein
MKLKFISFSARFEAVFATILMVLLVIVSLPGQVV